MNAILYFFRDTISGTYYFIYCFICLLLMFSIIGYLFKQKYAKVEIKLNTSQSQQEEKVNKEQNKVSKNEPVVQKTIEKPIQDKTLIIPKPENLNIEPKIIKSITQPVNQNINITPSQPTPQVVNRNLGVNNAKSSNLTTQVNQTPINNQQTVPLKKAEI